MNRRAVCLLVISLVFVPAKRAAAEPCSTVAINTGLGDIGSLIKSEMQKAKLPGLSIAVVRGGKMVCVEGFGLRDVQHNLPVTSKTIFAIGSTSKSFTALAMGILNDEGKLDWDKPARNYLPEFEMRDPVASDRMTPRDLITHRVGFARHDLVWYTSDFSRADLVRRLRYLDSDRDFRSGYQYNNLLVATAGYLVGKIDGTTWEDFVRRRILVPLQMQNTNFSVSDSQHCPDYSLPYKKEENSGVVKQIDFHPLDAIGPAGSINSNVEDLSNYVIMQLAKGKFAGRQIVSEANLELMHSPQTAMPMPAQFRELGQMSYAMGWVAASYRGHRYIWHNGGIDGFYALIAMLPDDDLGVIVLTNTLGSHKVPEIVAYNIFDHVLGMSPIDWSDRFEKLSNKDKQAEPPGQVREKNAETGSAQARASHNPSDYLGRYENPGYGVVEIRPAGQDFTLALNKLSAPLKHLDYDVFKVPEDSDSPLAGTKFQFGLSTEGTVATVSAPLQPGVKEIEFRRLPNKLAPGALLPLSGAYTLGSTPIQVALRGDDLYLILPGQPAYRLTPVKDLQFEVSGMSGYSVEFKKDSKGQISSLELAEPEGISVAKRN
ncbi:MAG TPA: serine hydrolase [Candidatus Acidoferrum sp.]|nr:serine hydrolase [Candidatus Acidoferrum sp.]